MTLPAHLAAMQQLFDQLTTPTPRALCSACLNSGDTEYGRPCPFGCEPTPVEPRGSMQQFDRNMAAWRARKAAADTQEDTDA